MAPAAKNAKKPEEVFNELRRRVKPALEDIRAKGHTVEMRPVAANVMHVHCTRCHNGSDITYTEKHVYLNNQGLSAKCNPTIQPATHTELCIIRRPATGHRQRIYRHTKSQQLYAEYIRDDDSSGASHMLTPVLLDMMVQDLAVENLVLDRGHLPPELFRLKRTVAKKTGGKKGAKKTVKKPVRRK